MDKQGNSPLHLCKTIGILKLLIKFGSDPCLKNKKGETPVEVFNSIFDDEHVTIGY